MRKHWQYFRYVARHKWFVFKAGRKMGVGFWQLLIHDWSKLLPSEWKPYVDYFYGEVKAGRGAKTLIAARESRFDRAWLHHIHANPHHWQHWVLREDSGETKFLIMPEKYMLEMCADWAGAGMAISGRADPLPWYQENVGKIQLHPLTRQQVERTLAVYSSRLVIDQVL